MTRSATAPQNMHDRSPQWERRIAPAAIIGSPEQAKAGSLLIRPGTLLPHNLALSLRRIGPWNLIADLSASELDRLVRSEGWHVFFVVPPVEATGLGLSVRSAVRKALAGVVRQVEARDLNAVEIADIRVRRLLNLHYVRIMAHPRHVRDSPFLRDLDPNHRVEGMWNHLRIFEIRNRKVEQRKGI